MLMADSDLSSSILSSRSPLIPNSVETLDESSSSSSPIASIGAHVVQSLALSSPNRDRDDNDKVSLSTEVSIPPRNSDGSSLNETLIVSSPVSLKQGPESQILNSFQIGSTSQAPDEIDEAFFDSYSSYRLQPWARFPSSIYDSDSDDDYKMECSQPLLRYKQEPVKIIEPTGVGAGLWNLGNTCFFNSVMQCITHTVPLIESLRSYKYQHPCNCGNEVFCVIRTLREHIRDALRPSSYIISPYYFLNNLNYFSPYFQRYQQEDAHEFLQAFLDKLEKCCLDRRIYRGNISSQDVNIVEHVFGGRLVSGLRCCNCNSVSETFESSLGLSLEIEDVDNLWNALESFTCVEKLEEQLTCDNCNEKVSKEKQLLLDKLPLVATFHLKRFKNNGFFMEKIFKPVRIPLELDLEPYMRDSQENEVPTKYHLYALVEHLGISLAYGHYSSYVRSAPKIWHKFDDEQVTRIDEDSVLSHDSYILFYAREGTPWFSRAFEEMQPLLEASLSSPKSVLDPTNGECLSEISYENGDKPNKPCDSAGVSNPNVKIDENCVSLSNEPNEDVFLSAGEDSPMAELLDPLYDSYPPCTEPSDSCLAVERAIAGDEFVSVLMVQNKHSSPKQQEGTFHIQPENLESTKNQEEPYKQPLISDEPNKDVSLSESSGEDSPMAEVLDSYNPGNEKEPDSCLAIERGTTSDEFVPLLMVQNQDSSPKQQEGSFHVQLEHLESAKNQEEEACKQPLISDVADSMETEFARGELVKKQSPRARELFQAIAYSGSPPKRIKTEAENENL